MVVKITHNAKFSILTKVGPYLVHPQISRFRSCGTRAKTKFLSENNFLSQSGMIQRSSKVFMLV